MVKGDWIEQRDAPNTRGIVEAIHFKEPGGAGCECCRCARWLNEGVPMVTMQLSGDTQPFTCTMAEIKQHWEPMRFTECSTPPWWCTVGSIWRAVLFDSKGGVLDRGKVPLKATLNYVAAKVLDVKPGWVAYLDTSTMPRTPMFTMSRWWEFRRIWEPETPPNAWQRVLQDD